MESVDVPGLAKELGLSMADVIRHARALEFNLVRGAAKLTSKQATAIRRRVEGERVRRAKVLTSVTAPPAPAPPSVPVAGAPDPAPIPSREPDRRAERAWARGRRCSCCWLPFAPRTGVGLESVEAERCELCREHYEVRGEEDARARQRLADHDVRVRAAFGRVADIANDSEERVSYAFSSRQKWFGALVEVILAHDERPNGKCTCGADRFPCFTVKKLEEANRGIAMYIEKLGALSQKDLDAKLYPDRPPREWVEDF